MNVDFVARNFELDDKTRNYAEKQLRKAARFLEDPVDVRWTLEVAKHRQKADLHIAHRFGVIQAAEETGQMKDSIHQAAEKAEKQARRTRKKFKDRKRKATKTAISFDWPLEIVDPQSLQSPEGPKVLETTSLRIQPMSLETAAAQLEESAFGFIVYRDEGSEQIQVLYKRADDNYGLLKPEL